MPAAPRSRNNSLLLVIPKLHLSQHLKLPPHYLPGRHIMALARAMSPFLSLQPALWWEHSWWRKEPWFSLQDPGLACDVRLFLGEQGGHKEPLRACSSLTLRPCSLFRNTSCLSIPSSCFPNRNCLLLGSGRLIMRDD